MKESKSKYAILGILSFGPMSGYDIKKFYEQSIASFWNESYGQIYPILKWLKELVAVEELKDRFQDDLAQDSNLPFWLLAFDYGKYVNQAYIQWAQEALTTLRELETNLQARKK